MKLEDFVDEFVTVCGTNWSKYTVRTYEDRIGAFIKCVRQTGDIGISDISIKHVTSFLNSLKELSWHTRRGSFVAVKVFCKWLAVSGYTNEDFFSRYQQAGVLKLPPRPRTVVKTIKKSYIKTMITTAEQELTNPVAIRDTAIMRLLYTTGLRRGELLNLTLESLDFGSKTILVNGKSGERYVYPSANTWSALEKWLTCRPKVDDNTLFISMREGNNGVKFTKLHRDTIGNILRKWRNRSGIPKVSVSPHFWRRTFASEFVENEGDCFCLQELMGHRNIATTRIYVRPLKNIPELARRYSPEI